MARTVQLPSVQVDNVREDLGDATRGTVLSGNVEPFALADGETLTISVDGGGVQTVTIRDVDFDDVAAATAAELALSVVGQTTGLGAEDDGGALRLTTETWGSGGSVDVTGGTANVGLAFPTGASAGTDFTPVVQPINRNPEPGEIQVLRTAPVEVELHDGDGVAPATAGVQVWVAGVLAYDGGAGGFQAGFSGTATNPDAATLRLVIQRATQFASFETVPVRVAESVSALDSTYSFTTLDETAPTVVSATARSQTVVRVVFSEPILQVDPAGTDDALNPDHYAFTRLAVPAVDVEPVSVAVVDATTVDVTVDVELSFNAPYLVTVVDVEDVWGNIVGPPTNTAEFLSLAQPWPAGRRCELIEWIPQINRTEDATGELAAWIACLQDVFDVLLAQVDRWVDVIDPDVAPERYLDAMLADLGLPFAWVELSEIDKRRLIRVLIDIYRAKGTKQGIVDVVRFLLGLDVTIEIFNGIGWELAAADSPTLDGRTPPSGPGDELSSAAEVAPDPAELGPGELRLLYTFEIHSAIELTPEQRERITDLANFMKPAHTHLLRIVEPSTPVVYDHLELGVSELGKLGAGPGTWRLH